MFKMIVVHHTWVFKMSIASEFGNCDLTESIIYVQYVYGTCEKCEVKAITDECRISYCSSKYPTLLFSLK